MVVRSYNGWTASRDPKAIGINTAWEPIPGHKFPGGVKSGDVETVMTYVVRQLHKRVEPVDRDAIKDEWGWYFKPSANSPDLISCHSSGTAFDYNATRHPNGHRGTFSAKQVAEIRKIQAEVGGVVYWGGDRGHADEMHFEVDGTPAEVAAVAKRLRAPKPAPKPIPTPSKETNMAAPYAPYSLWRDSRNSKLYRVPADHMGKVWIQSTAAKDFDASLLTLLDPAWAVEQQANNANLHAWLDSIPTVT